MTASRTLRIRFLWATGLANIFKCMAWTEGWQLVSLLTADLADSSCCALNVQRRAEQRRLSIVDPPTRTEVAVAEVSQVSPAGSQAGPPQQASSTIQQPSQTAGKQQSLLRIANPETGQAIQLHLQVHLSLSYTCFATCSATSTEVT